MGRIGTLRPNCLGRREGPFFPTLPRSIDRILPFLGRGGLRDVGWDLSLQERQGHLVPKVSGASIRVRYCNDINLPVLSSKFLDKYSIAQERNPKDSAPPRAAGYYIHDNELLCSPCDGDVGTTYLSKLDTHRRCGHFFVPGLSVTCPTCSSVEGQRRSHAKVKSSLRVKAPLRTVAFDFSGEIRIESMNKNRFVLVVICTSLKCVWIRQLRYKSLVAETIADIDRTARAE